MKKRHILLVLFLFPIIATQSLRMALGPVLGTVLGVLLGVGFAGYVWYRYQLWLRPRILSIIEKKPEGCTGREIGKALYLTAPHVALGSLLEDGYLEHVVEERTTVTSDGRALDVSIYRCVLTAKGRRELARYRVERM
ncbi:MAG: hypothetical protein QY323_03640 [Patescibacteria group bacterium]|nr:MAG: hypothetical protein QY323_03640 [Patescibacteria group bacterium]